MASTSVLSIRIDNETRDMLESHAKALGMKISLLSSHVLRDMTEIWVRDYARKIALQYGLVNEEDLSKGDEDDD
ncbi:MAG: hypothetical protein ACXAC7_15790 [Candidatus Hodarchaeales archaeon]|jgi:hypothetical protein